MLKPFETMKEFEADAQTAMRNALANVPLINGIEIEVEPPAGHRSVDFLVRLQAHRQKWILACEVKSNGQPRIIRNAAHQLHEFAAQLGPRTIPVLMTPYFTREARALCHELKVGYLDFQGNCRITFDGVYIERESASRPQAARRELRSIFKPKSAQVLRVLLRVPERTWKVADLAREADVSLGHVSNVSSALIDREWASRDETGLKLTRPGALLDNWRENYEPPAGVTKRFYTLLHGKAFDEAARVLMRQAPRQVALGSLSAAQWLAPYGRSSTHYLYADREAMVALRNLLRAEPAAKGENLVVTVLNDDGVLRDAIEPSPGIYTTSPAQTYLDLAHSGERGQEAADHLREERLSWLS